MNTNISINLNNAKKKKKKEENKKKGGGGGGGEGGGDGGNVQAFSSSVYKPDTRRIFIDELGPFR